MTKYFLYRLLQLIPILISISVLVFLMIHLAPGDPVLLLMGDEGTYEDYRRLQELYGLDLPLYQQYFRWVGNALQGNLGISIRQGAPVSQLIFERLGPTFELAIASVILATILGIPIGVLAAIKRQSFVDFFSMIFALIGVSMPPFWLGLVLLAYVSMNVGFFPMFGREGSIVGGLWIFLTSFNITPLYDGFRYLFLPAASLAIAMMAIITRLTRSSLLEVMGKDYIRTARSKGIGEKVVIFKHGLRNALLPVVTIIGIQFGFLLGGAVITETVFAWPGAGRLVVNAIIQRDFPIIQGGVLMLAIAFTLVNLLVDLSYALLDPRIRYQ